MRLETYVFVPRGCGKATFREESVSICAHPLQQASSVHQNVSPAFRGEGLELEKGGGIANPLF